MKYKGLFYLRFLVLVSLFISANLLSQSVSHIHEQLRFKYLNVDNGLTNNRVRGITQDKYGFIWLGTRKGISRYNGYHIDQYLEYYEDGENVFFRETRGIFCDSSNTIWVTGNYGICFYDWIENKFKKFKHPDITGDLTYSGGVDGDLNGNIWFSTNLGIMRYNPTENTIKIIEHKENTPGYLPPGSLEKILVDSNNNIWFGYLKEGVGYYNQETGKIYHFTSSDDPFSVVGNRVERLYEDTEGNIWIGDYNDGVSKYSFKTGKFKRYYIEPGVKESGRVRGMAEDPKGNFWFGTQAGLYLFNRADETFFKYAYVEHPISILGHNSIQDILIDNQEGLWLGTHAGGASYTNLNASGFIKYMNSNIPSNYFLNDKNVYSLAFDKNNNIWVGTENGGLNYLDRKSGKFTYFKINPDNSNSPTSNNIKDIRIDENNNIWFGTYRGGLNFYNTTSKKFKSFAKSKDNPNGLEDETVYCLFFDPVDPNMLWVGCIEGLYLMDIKNESFTKITGENKAFSNVPELSSRIFSIYASNDKVFFGLNKLSVLDRKTNAFKTYEMINKVGISQIDFIISDKNNNIWFGLNSAYLVRFDITKNQFKLYGHEQGLPLTELLEAEDDKFGNIWISTSNGIIKLENIIDTPESFTIRTYDNSDNLQSLEFLYHSKAESPAGEILFGGINGFNSFKPENIKLNPYKPNAIITKLVISNREVGVNEEVFGRKLLNKPILETDFIQFHYKIKTFTFYFTAFHFVAPENNKFAYKLEGYDDDWNYTDANVRFASYSNIKRGNYIFKVKASNNNGVWMDNPVTINIKITPPFWKTYWFYGIVVFVIAFMVYLFIKWREEQLRRDKETLQHQLAEGKKEIEKSKEILTKQTEELQRRDIAEREQKWYNTGMVKIGDIITQNKDNIEELSKKFLNRLLEYLDAEQGVIYILNDDDVDHKYLEYLVGFGLTKKKLKQKRIEIGENLIGTCFKEGQIIQMENISEDYTQINSGIGNTSTLHLILIPFKQDKLTLGVIELASLKKVEQFKLKFIEDISSMFSANLFSSKTGQKMNELLLKTQKQTEELHAQEEELRQNMEEMLATQDEASRKEHELIEINEMHEKKETELLAIIKEKEQLISRLKK